MCVFRKVGGFTDDIVLAIFNRGNETGIVRTHVHVYPIAHHHGTGASDTFDSKVSPRPTDHIVAFVVPYLVEVAGVLNDPSPYSQSNITSLLCRQTVKISFSFSANISSTFLIYLS